MGALAAVVLPGITGLAALAAGLGLWLAREPPWALFKTSLAAFACALLLLLIVLGGEFGWWQLAGETVDSLGLAWIGVTLAGAAATWWLVR